MQYEKSWLFQIFNLFCCYAYTILLFYYPKLSKNFFLFFVWINCFLLFIILLYSLFSCYEVTWNIKSIDTTDILFFSRNCCFFHLSVPLAVWLIQTARIFSILHFKIGNFPQLISSRISPGSCFRHKLPPFIKKTGNMFPVSQTPETVVKKMRFCGEKQSFR